MFSLLVSLLLKKVILEDLYEEVSNILTPDQFEELYDYCVKDNQYGSLIIDSSHKEKRFMSGLDSLLTFKEQNEKKNIYTY